MKTKFIILLFCLLPFNAFAIPAGGVVDSFNKMLERYGQEHQPSNKFTGEPLEILQNINWHVNRRLKYITEDTQQWDTPAETEKRWGGDCEEFAGYKWHLAKENGFLESQMYFLVGQQLERRRHHIILVVEVGKDKVYLDSFSNKMYVNEVPLVSGKKLKFNRDDLGVVN